jgi:hypothetical protein
VIWLWENARECWNLTHLNLPLILKLIVVAIMGRRSMVIAALLACVWCAALVSPALGFPVATSLNGMSGEPALLDLFKCGARHFGSVNSPWDENCTVDTTTG